MPAERTVNFSLEVLNLFTWLVSLLFALRPALLGSELGADPLMPTLVSWAESSDPPDGRGADGRRQHGEDVVPRALRPPGAPRPGHLLQEDADRRLLLQLQAQASRGASGLPDGPRGQGAVLRASVTA